MGSYIKGDMPVFGSNASVEIMKLKREISRIKTQIRDNERVWSGFRYVEIGVIGARSLRELFEVFTDGFSQAFPDIDCVTLACFDPDYEMTRLLEKGRSNTPQQYPDFVRITPEALDELFSHFTRPMLGRCNGAMQQLLFPNYNDTLGSVAIAPLILQDRLIGCLNQGSKHPNHFSADAQTDFLEHLAAVTAVCIDNAVNHERLREDGLTDPLTGLANRRFFERRLGEEVKRWMRHSKDLSCLMVDIDLFKKINDTYGHQHGDYVLQEV
ncbi:MAG: DUF484 family protein, partial [Gammaproteobacteria bacterium]|nr:DUF484 family protein [Gammaproteobacteria bacterium]